MYKTRTVVKICLLNFLFIGNRAGEGKGSGLAIFDSLRTSLELRISIGNLMHRFTEGDYFKPLVIAMPEPLYLMLTPYILASLQASSASIPRGSQVTLHHE